MSILNCEYLFIMYIFISTVLEIYYFTKISSILITFSQFLYFDQWTEYHRRTSIVCLEDLLRFMKIYNISAEKIDKSMDNMNFSSLLQLIKIMHMSLLIYNLLTRNMSNLFFFCNVRIFLCDKHGKHQNIWLGMFFIIETEKFWLIFKYIHTEDSIYGWQLSRIMIKLSKCCSTTYLLANVVSIKVSEQKEFVLFVFSIFTILSFSNSRSILLMCISLSYLFCNFRQLRYVLWYVRYVFRLL